MDAVEWRDNQMCFACGKNNPAGFKLDFTPLGDDGLQSTFVPDPIYQGFENIVHGGILSLLLDEVMVNLPYQRMKKVVVTAELKIRLFRPAFIGKKLIIQAFPDGESNHRLVLLKGEIKLEDGTLIAKGKAKCIEMENRE